MRDALLDRLLRRYHALATAWRVRFDEPAPSMPGRLEEIPGVLRLMTARLTGQTPVHLTTLRDVFRVAEKPEPHV